MLNNDINHKNKEVNYKTNRLCERFVKLHVFFVVK